MNFEAQIYLTRGQPEFLGISEAIKIWSEFPFDAVFLTTFIQIVVFGVTEDHS